MRGYESWSFRDRSFLSAIGVSLLWHFFWFYSVQIDMRPQKKKHTNSPVIVSLGPALQDTIFRTLVETKPIYTETFYRRLSDFSNPIDVEVAKMTRYSPGDVVSVPFGQKVMNSLKELVGGNKLSPDYEFSSRLKLGYSEGLPDIEGDARNRPIVHRPGDPQFKPDWEDAARTAEVELLFTVEPAGTVSAAEILTSSGNDEVDAVWVRYLKGWQFAPLELDKAPVQQRGKVKLHFTEAKG